MTDIFEKEMILLLKDAHIYLKKVDPKTGRSVEKDGDRIMLTYVFLHITSHQIINCYIQIKKNQMIWSHTYQAKKQRIMKCEMLLQLFQQEKCIEMI